MLTLIGHQKSIVVMAQLSFHGGVSAAQQATAERLTRETFALDTGGGLILPAANPGASSERPVRPAAAPAQAPPPPPAGPGSPLAGVVWKPIPKGKFRMGCVDGDKRCGAERAHEVTLTRAFDMAETETTNASYKACVKAGACQALPPSEWICKNNEPVVNVSRGDAAAFCAWAGGRLPSEAEWEFAARGGKDGLIYPNGNTISHDEANFTDTGGRDQWKEVAPVKSFPPNGYGLYDMAGNVWEWVADWYGSWGNEPAVDPRGPATGDAHVNRGGSWYSFESFLRTSYRVRIEPGVRFDYGFRCVRDAP
jgi:formylglycine-generating enzyme required for sulfatase activity